MQTANSLFIITLNMKHNAPVHAIPALPFVISQDVTLEIRNWQDKATAAVRCDKIKITYVRTIIRLLVNIKCKYTSLP